MIEKSKLQSETWLCCECGANFNNLKVAISHWLTFCWLLSVNRHNEQNAYKEYKNKGLPVSRMTGKGGGKNE